MRHKDGHEIWFETIGQIIFDTLGVNTGAVFSTRDISERKAAEDQRHQLEERLRQTQKMEAIGQLAGGIAHDFNNILAVIIGDAELVLDEMPPQQPGFENISSIKSAAERAAALTRQLLTFSRKQVVTPRLIDPARAIDHAHRMLSRIIGEHIELSCHYATPPWMIAIDPVQLDQILVNLCINARDAMPDGGRLDITTANLPAADPAGSDRVQITVADNGSGMDEHTRHHLFEPFFTTKERAAGTGLGLATVYGIVEQNHATIGVDSTPGAGTTFLIGFPRAQGSADDSTPPHPEPASPDESNPPPHPANETVLVVEDEEMVRSLVRTILDKQGYRVLEAACGEDALDLARHYPQPIDLLITDVIMPGMKGAELAARLQAERPQIKTLFMSGYTENIIAPQGILAENTNYIQKPFSITDLARKVRTILDS